MASQKTMMDYDELKLLMGKYRDEPNGKNLEKLIKFTDEHLATCIRVLRHKYKFVWKEEEEDIYPWCIIALTKASCSMKDNHVPEMLGTRIYQYCKSETFIHIKKFFAERCGVPLAESEFAISDAAIQNPMILDDLLRKIAQLIQKGKLQLIDYVILVEKSVWGRTNISIAEKTGLRQEHITPRWKRTLEVLRKNLDKEDFILE